MHQRKCKYCKELFVPKYKRQRYCSQACRMEDHDFRIDSGNGQICWRCGNYCGGCSWSRDGTPVKGWKATETAVKNRGELEFYSYKIIYCPEYVQDVKVRLHK